MTWPYDDPEDVLTASESPSWDCPQGICACHPSTTSEMRAISILLRDYSGERMPGAACRLWYNGRLFAADLVADGKGVVRPDVPEDARVVFLEWAPPTFPRNEGYPISKSYIVTLRQDDRRQKTRERLANLGHHHKKTLADNVRGFEAEHELEPPTGDWRRIERAVADFHDLGVKPEPAPAVAEGTTFALFDAPGDPGGDPGGDPAVPSKQGSSGFKRDFPTPKEAEAQAKIFHEFQSTLFKINDGGGSQWTLHLLVSHDALKWEVPTETVRGPGVSKSEGKWWENRFRDLTNADPFVPSSFDPKRVVRIPSTAKDAQEFADTFTFSVAQLLNLPRLQSLKEQPIGKAAPSKDLALKCFLPTPTIMDLRWDRIRVAKPCTHSKGGTTTVSVMIPQVRSVNNEINGLHNKGSSLVGNPGKVWAISNKLYRDPHGAKVRKKHSPSNIPLGVNYGWHTDSQAKAGPHGGVSQNGQFFVMQKAATGHHIRYKDYSQVVVLVAGWCTVHNPHTKKWTWEPTEDLYLNQGNIKAFGTANSFSLQRFISVDDLVTTNTY